MKTSNRFVLYHLKYCIALVALLCPVVSHANEHDYRIVNDELPLTLTAAEPATLELDLSEFSRKEAVYAALRIQAKVTTKAASAPMLGLYVPNRDTLIAQAHIDHGSSYTYNLTQVVNHALAEGLSTATLRLAPVPGLGGNAEFSLTRIQFFLADQNIHQLTLEQMTTPFWLSGKVWGETVFPNNKQIPLLGRPLEMPHVYNGLRTKAYAPNDFKVKGNELLLTDKVSNLIFSDDKLLPANKEMALGRAFKSKSGGYILSPEGSWFQTHQLSVDYSFDPDTWTGPRPLCQPGLLPKTMAKLEAKEPLTLMLYGDSIASGANATGLLGDPPYQWSWGQLIVDSLETRFGSEIDYINASFGGTTAKWGKLYARSLVAPLAPDLVILAFGMNGEIPPTEFRELIQHIMATVRNSNPDAEFILVQSMQPNKNFKRHEIHQSYAAELEALQGPGVLFADMWSMHGALIEKKRYVDMTGNHVNHPNDFLIRVYAQVILSRLIDFE